MKQTFTGMDFIYTGMNSRADRQRRPSPTNRMTGTGMNSRSDRQRRPSPTNAAASLIREGGCRLSAREFIPVCNGSGTDGTNFIPACKIIALALALLLIISITGCKKKQAASEDAPDGPAAPVTIELLTVTAQTIDQTVRGTGTIAPGQGAMAHVAASVAGRLLQVTVREGETVSAGQVVAVVDNRPQQAMANSANYALAASESQAKQSELSYAAAAADQQEAVKAAQISLAAANTDLKNNLQTATTAMMAAQIDRDRITAGARPQEIAQAAAAVAQADATRKRAVTERDRVAFLFGKGISPKRQLDDAETALSVATSALTSAEQAENLLKAGARPEDLRAAQIKVQQANEAVQAAGTSGAAKVKQAEAVLEQAKKSALTVDAKRQEAEAARRGVAQKQADYKAAAATANYSEVRAPLSGVVSKRMLNPGDMADVNLPILDISNPTSVNLVANLTAEDGALVRPGMTAKIIPADAPESVAAARVLSVGTVDTATNLLTVRLILTGSGNAIKSGAFATAEIVVRHAANAVVVPKVAIVSREDKSVVYVIDGDNTAHQREVKTGAETNGTTEIVSGLKVGEKIAKLGQFELSDGAKVREAEKPAADAAASKEP